MGGTSGGSRLHFNSRAQRWLRCFARSAMGAVGTLLLFSVLMVAVPLGAFFATQQGRLDEVLQPLLGQQTLQDNRTVVAGALGVLAVNAVVAVFVAVAWLEPPPPPQDAASKKGQ